MAKHKLPVFRGNLIVRGKIEAVTGLHIGGSKEKMQIGGVDLVVIRHPTSKYPYIPGSSLKGKLRHLLEYATGGVNHPFQGQLGQVSVDTEIVRLFGIGAEVLELAHNEKMLKEDLAKAEKNKDNDKIEYLNYVGKNLKSVGLPRLIVRDAMPDEATVKMWESMSSDSNFTEYKAENTIDRLTSAANPRFIERVVAGSKFDFEIVYTAYGPADGRDETEKATIDGDIRNLLGAMRLLEHSALGKAGTRGYGRVKFKLAKPEWIMAEDYLAIDAPIFEKLEQLIPEEEFRDLNDYRTEFEYA